MIEAVVLIGESGEWSEVATFPVLPTVGQSLLVWRGREQAPATVTSVYFSQDEGFYQPVIVAKFATD